MWSIPPPVGVPSTAAVTDNGLKAEGIGNASVTSDWMQLADDSGQTYWWNKVTHVSRWEKPEELKQDYEKQELTDWREFMDDNGRKYYHNEKNGQTTWSQPDEFRLYLERLEKRKRDAEEANETPMEKLLKTVFPEEPLKNKFAHLLTERNMLSSWSWEQAVSATFEDDRSKALKMAERKQVYQLMVTKLKTFEVEERKRRERALVTDFFAMLDSWSDYDRYSTYREMCEQYADHSALISVTSESMRSRLFTEYKSMREKAERDKERIENEEKVNAFHDWLEEQNIPPTKRWKELVEESASVPQLQHLELIDRLRTFSEYIHLTARAEDAKLSAERRRARSTSRKIRESYYSLLVEKFALVPSSSQSSVHSETPWFEFLPLISSDPRYQAMLTTSGSTPAELYYDFVHGLRDEFAKERRKVKNVARSFGIRILQHSQPSVGTTHSLSTRTTTELQNLTLEEAPKLDFSEWAHRIRNHTSGIDDHSLRRIYDEFAQRELSKFKTRIERARTRFMDALRRALSNPAGYASVDSLASTIGSSAEFQLLTDAEKLSLAQDAHQKRNKGSEAEELSAEGPPRDADSSSHQKSLKGRHKTSTGDYDSESDSYSSDEGAKPRRRRRRGHGASSPRKASKHEEDSAPKNV